MKRKQFHPLRVCACVYASIKEVHGELKYSAPNHIHVLVPGPCNWGTDQNTESALVFH